MFYSVSVGIGCHRIHQLTDGITDLDTEGKEEDHTDGVEPNTKEKISDDPSVVECPHDQDQLRDKVDDHTDQWEDEVGDEKTGSVGVRHAGVSVESRDSDEEAHAKNSQAG